MGQSGDHPPEATTPRNASNEAALSVARKNSGQSFDANDSKVEDRQSEIRRNPFC